MKLASLNLVFTTRPAHHVPTATQAQRLSTPPADAPRHSSRRRRRRRRRRPLHASQYLGASPRRADRAVGDSARQTQSGHHHPDHVNHGEKYETRIEGEELVPHSERFRAERRRHAVLRGRHPPKKAGLVSCCSRHRQHYRASGGEHGLVVILDDVVARQAPIGQSGDALFASADHEVAPQDARPGMENSTAIRISHHSEHERTPFSSHRRFPST